MGAVAKAAAPLTMQCESRAPDAREVVLGETGIEWHFWGYPV